MLAYVANHLTINHTAYQICHSIALQTIATTSIVGFVLITKDISITMYKNTNLSTFRSWKR